MTEKQYSVTVTVHRKTTDEPLGIHIVQVNGQIYVKRIAPDGPFQGTTIQEGDRIVAINDIPCACMSLHEAWQYLEAIPYKVALTLVGPVSVFPAVAAKVKDQSLPSGPPRGVRPGGVWGRGRHFGPTSCAHTAALCLLGGFMVAWVPLVSPCDEMELYKCGDKFYNANGKYVGAQRNIRDFVPYHPVAPHGKAS